MKTSRRLLNLLTSILMISAVAMADATISLVRRDANTVAIMLQNSEPLAGAQMTISASASLTIFSVSASGVFSGSNWMFASNLSSGQELRIVVMGTSQSDLGNGSVEIARFTIGSSDNSSNSFALTVGNLVISNGRCRRVAASSSHLTWNGSFDPSERVNFSLNGNYPNPFNPSTVITYTIDRTTDVQLAVYDILGREVKVLVSGTQHAGTHQTTWTIERGSIATGSYFARLLVDGRSQIARMIVAQ